MPFVSRRSSKLWVALTLGLAIMIGFWADRLVWGAPSEQGLPPPGATATLPPPGRTPTLNPYPSPQRTPTLPSYPSPSITPTYTPSQTPDPNQPPTLSPTPRLPTVGPSMTAPPPSVTPRPYPYPGPLVTPSPATALPSATPRSYPYPGPSVTLPPPPATRQTPAYPYPAPTHTPPANDECRTATLIPANGPWPFEITQDTRYARPSSIGEMALCGGEFNSHTVWFRWTAPVDGSFQFSTCGSNYDTVVTVWQGECYEAELVACNDDWCDRQARVVFDTEQGVSYLFRVASYNLTSGGNLKVAAQFTPDSALTPLPTLGLPGTATPCAYPGPYPYPGPCVASVPTSSATPTASPTPSITATTTPTLTSTATSTSTDTPTPTLTPTVTLTPTPTLTPTITPTPTPVPIVCDPNIPGNICNGTVLARVYIDMVCDNYFNPGIDWPLADAEMMVQLSNGQLLTGRGNANGYVTVQGVHILAGTTASVTLVKAPPPEWVIAQGNSLGMCRQASPTRPLSDRDFRDGVAQIEYRLRLN